MLVLNTNESTKSHLNAFTTKVAKIQANKLKKNLNYETGSAFSR